jgi:CheY-like chemotaxis protein
MMVLEPDGPCPCEILLIEDDDDYRDVVRDVLEEEGYRVATASNGRDALERLRTQPPPDLILTDLWMPRMDGWAFVAAVKELSDLAPIPMVVTSGSGDGAHPPCAAYLPKPVSLALLLHTLAACLAARGRS